MILMCMWKGKKMNCSDIFTIRKTDNGFCCSFNSLKTSEMFKMGEDNMNTISKDDMADFFEDYSEDNDNIDYFWSSSESIYGCGGILTEDSGHMISPKVKELLQCEWIIRAPTSKRIHLSFQQFGTTNYNYDFKCLDYVSIYDGGSPKFPLLGRYCGHIIPPNHFSTGNQILIRYKSENSLTTIGFTAHYQLFANNGSFENSTFTEDSLIAEGVVKI